VDDEAGVIHLAMAHCMHEALAIFKQNSFCDAGEL